MKQHLEIFLATIVVNVFQWCGFKLFKERTDFFIGENIVGVAFYSDKRLKNEIYDIRDRLNKLKM